MKYLIYFFIILISSQCSSDKYIVKIPFKYSYDKNMLIKKFNDDKLLIANSNKTIFNENISNLDDETLKLKEKYSIMMGVNPSYVTNYKLYKYIDELIKSSKDDRDFSENTTCSIYLQPLCSNLYGVTLPKDPSGIFKSEFIQLFTGRRYLLEGDIVFFRYSKDVPISDVALYLQNDRILACTKSGLAVYNFKENYFQERYVASGRVIKNK